MNTTPWFGGHVKPVRVGWYEVKGDFLQNETAIITSHNECTFRYWNGKDWMWKSPDCKKLVPAGFGRCDLWRGLTEEMK